MPIDKKNTKRIAWLARIAVDESEMPSYVEDLAGIMGLAEQVLGVNAQGVEAMAHPLEMDALLRDDQVAEDDQRACFQETAPDVAEGYYLVPKVLE